MFHACIFTNGLCQNTFISSKLLTCYQKFGFSVDSRWVFDGIIKSNIFLWNSILVGCFRSSKYGEVLRLYLKLKQKRIGLDGSAITFTLKSCVELGSLGFGKGVHLDVFKFGLSKNQFVGSSLIGLYSRYGDMLAYKAFEFACSMQKEGVDPNRVTMVSLLQAAAELEALEHGGTIHGYAIRRGIDCLDEIFETSLMDMYIKCKVPTMAACIFGRMKMKTIGSWNAMITGYINMGKPLEALGHFCYELDLVSTTALVDMYSMCNDLVRARQLFKVIETRDVILYNVMMSGYLQNGFATDSIDIFIEMVCIGLKPNLGSILNVLSALLELNNVRGGRSVHGYILRHEFLFDRIQYKDLVSWTSMMMGYICHGHPDEAIILFQKMKSEGLDYDSVTLTSLLQASSKLGYLSLAKEVHCHSNLFEHTTRRCLTSWNTMISAYGMHGKCKEALLLFDRMKNEMIKPDDTTFTSILTACSHSGMVEEGLQVFYCMRKEYGIIPCEAHYGCIVDLLSRAGRLEEAYKLLKLVPARQSASALAALLAACRIHGNTELGEIIGNWILDLEPENPSVYNLVSNLYAESGKWDDSARTRNMAKMRGLKKAAGYSLIELNPRVSTM
ncbi:Mitochondrial saccharopine dehydrogenase isoform 1 [Hibiscus syriacus]|uniref:Mitochondrial saccharopine dehydrogenase isoform 1 n=1 Tax=Hibiscus syriacus TaxID=106335 RepID=A0A6A2ZWH9_HIBSY|nr:Mitochondrial saccharopine dehydrogenase isoform 1 [Hibiscus syriacus]